MKFDVLKKISGLGSKRTALAMTLMLIFVLAACGDPLPIESMTEARYAIGKAESVNSAKYSKENLEKAQAKLIESHTFASEKKMKDSKASADEAKRLAELAFNESIPLLASDTKGEAQALIQEAEALNAEEFASEELSKAKSLMAEAQQAEDNKDYVTAHQKYEQAREEARKARDLSEAKIEFMKRDAAEIQQMVRQSERYGAKTKLASQYNAASNEVRKAQQEINSRDLKKASVSLKNARAQAQALLDSSQKSWASDRYAQAENELSKAEDAMTNLQNKLKNPNFKKLYDNSKAAQSAMQNTQNSLRAATNAKESAANYLRNRNYTQSYNQSSESIRLSKIVKDQTVQVAGIVESSKTRPEVVEVVVEKEEPTTQPPTTETAVEAPTKEEPILEEGWKSYTVRLIPQRRDCLWRIAGYDFIYNNPRLWSRIYKANKAQIKNPDLIYPGQIFNIPPAEGDFSQPPRATTPVSNETQKQEERTSTESGSMGGR